MKPEPTFSQLASDTVRILWALLRYRVAHSLLDLSWLAGFFMAKGTAAKLCRTARRVVPDAEQYRRSQPSLRTSVSSRLWDGCLEEKGVGFGR
jgi:hypothetical protein